MSREKRDGSAYHAVRYSEQIWGGNVQKGLDISYADLAE